MACGARGYSRCAGRLLPAPPPGLGCVEGCQGWWRAGRWLSNSSAPRPPRLLQLKDMRVADVLLVYSFVCTLMGRAFLSMEDAAPDCAVSVPPRGGVASGSAEPTGSGCGGGGGGRSHTVPCLPPWPRPVACCLALAGVDVSGVRGGGRRPLQVVAGGDGSWAGSPAACSTWRQQGARASGAVGPSPLPVTMCRSGVEHAPMPT